MLFSRNGSSCCKSPVFFVDLGCVLGLLLVGFLIFIQVAFFGAVSVDDPIFLVPSYKGGGFWASMRGAFTDVSSNLWLPLTRLSFSIEWWLFGSEYPEVHHATNLVLHLLNGVLIWACFRELGYSRPISFFTAAIFLAHPIQSEAVAWISSRKGILGSTFLLISTLSFLKTLRTKSINQTVTVHLFLIASLLSTPVGVIAPILFFLLYLIHRTLYEKKTTSRPEMEAFRSVVPYFIYSLLITIAAILVQSQGSHASAFWDREFITTIEDALAKLGMYFLKSIFPAGLTYHYVRPETVLLLVAVGSSILILMGLAFFPSFRWVKTAMAMALFTVLLLPTLGFVYVSDSFIATRYLSLAVVPIISLFTIPLSKKRSGQMILFAILVGYGSWGAFEVSCWRDNASLLSKAVERQPKSSHTQMNFANYLFADRQIQKARTHYHLAREIAGNEPDILYNLALLEYQAGNYALTKQLLDLCRNSSNNNPKILLYLAKTSLKMDLPLAQIIPLAEEYYRLEPDNFRAMMLLGDLYHRSGERQKLLLLSEVVLATGTLFEDEKVLFMQLLKE